MIVSPVPHDSDSCIFTGSPRWIFGLCLLWLWCAGTSATAIAQDAHMPFDIPAQPLAKALDTFAEQAHMQILSKTDTVKGLQSHEVSGLMTPEQALKSLLQGTGLSFQSGGPHTMIIVQPALPPNSQVTPDRQNRPAAQKPLKVPEIVVKDVRERDDANTYVAEEASTATRTDTPLIQIPQSVGVVTRQVMDDQKAVRMEQALRNVSGMAIGSIAQGRAANDTMFCRGFPCAFFKNKSAMTTFSKRLPFATSPISNDSKS